MRAIVLVSLIFLAGDDARREDEEVKVILQSLRAEKDAEKRLAHVVRLVELDTSKAAGLLASLVRRDPHPDVRVAAARGLGAMRTDSVVRHLLDLVREGGPQGVRRALGRSLATREDCLEPLLELLNGGRVDRLGQGLIVESFAEREDARTREILVRLTVGKDARVRSDALRALRRRPDAREALLERLETILRESRDVEAILDAVDALEEIEDPTMRPLVARLATFLEPEVQRAADYLERKLAYLDGVRQARRGALEGYGTPKPPPPPPERGRFDLVFTIDVTGSTVVILDDLKDRIRLETTLLRNLGCSLRVGIVGYRFWKDISLNVPFVEILPLTYDLSRVEAFLEELESRGPDSQGAAVSRGLSESLARMGWRWNAHRCVILIADSRCHDPAAAKLVTGIHFRADRTRTRVLYALRTRRKVPEDMTELARLGGTGVVELLE